MWTLGAFLFFGAVTGVLEMSDMGVLESTHAGIWADNLGVDNIEQCQVNIQTSSVFLCISLSDF